jgi:hypothetical protein
LLHKIYLQRNLTIEVPKRILLDFCKWSKLFFMFKLFQVKQKANEITGDISITIT